MFTKSWKVYGQDGHRQKISFEPSVIYDWSKDGQIRILELINSDKTGTNEYTIVKITRDTEKECDDEFFGQLSDGTFENARVGKYEEIKEAKEKMYKTVGRWWNDNDIELVEIDCEIYVLYGWNGEKFLHCWKCQDKFTEIGNEEYEIKPIYDEDDEDYEIIGYEVL